MKRNRKALGVKIYASLLFICLLEIVFWTSCWAGASPAGSADSHSYLIRETDNLKFAGRVPVKHRLPRADTVVAFHLERLLLAKQHEALDSNPEKLQPSLCTLRISEGATTGPPAPHSGIQAIT